MKKISQTYLQLLQYLQFHSSKEYGLPLISKAVLGVSLDDNNYSASLMKEVKEKCWDYMLIVNSDYKEYLNSFNGNILAKDLDEEKFKEYIDVLNCHGMCEKAIKDEKLFEEINVFEK